MPTLIYAHDSSNRPVWGYVPADGLLRYIGDPKVLDWYRLLGCRVVTVTREQYNAAPRAAGTHLAP